MSVALYIQSLLFPQVWAMNRSACFLLLIGNIIKLKNLPIQQNKWQQCGFCMHVSNIQWGYLLPVYMFLNYLHFFNCELSVHIFCLLILWIISLLLSPSSFLYNGEINSLLAMWVTEFFQVCNLSFNLPCGVLSWRFLSFRIFKFTNLFSLKGLDFDSYVEKPSHRKMNFHLEFKGFFFYM